MFRNADPSNLRGSLLEVNKDHLFNQARYDLAKQDKCIGELQRQTEEQRLALQDAQYGFVESRREKSSTTRRIVHDRKSSPKYHCGKNYYISNNSWEGPTVM